MSEEEGLANIACFNLKYWATPDERKRLICNI